MLHILLYWTALHVYSWLLLLIYLYLPHQFDFLPPALYILLLLLTHVLVQVYRCVSVVLLWFQRWFFVVFINTFVIFHIRIFSVTVVVVARVLLFFFYFSLFNNNIFYNALFLSLTNTHTYTLMHLLTHRINSEEHYLAK